MQAPARIRGADFAQPWHADAAERQVLEAERRHSTLMMTAAADGAWRAVSHRTQRADDILAIQDRNRILQVELNRLREEKATVEAEAQAFKQRMESAVSSFEVIIEQAVQEKANTFQQLVETRQRLKQSQRQQRTAAAKAGPKQLTRVFRICESRDTAVALARWRGFAGELRHDRAAEKIASFEAAARETVREREEEELLRSQLQCAVQRLAAADGAREEEQRKAEEARSARAEAEERLAGARVDLAESKESLRSLRAAFSAESVALSGESTALARRASELQGQLADAEHRAAQANERACELQAELERRAETWSLAAPGKVGLMRQMLHEQQEELAEARRFSAACKLVTAVGRRDTLSLSTALGAWRRACLLAREADLRHTPRLAKPAAEGLPFIPLASLGEAAAGISRDSPGRSSPPSQPPSGSLASPPSRLPPSQLRPRQVSPTAGDTPSTLPTMHSLETA